MERKDTFQQVACRCVVFPGLARERILVYRLEVMTLREQVEQMLPDWESWYPSLFDAARDLGLIRARVCDPGSLLLANRHAGVASDAARAYREKWSIEEEPAAPRGKTRRSRR